MAIDVNENAKIEYLGNLATRMVQLYGSTFKTATKSGNTVSFFKNVTATGTPAFSFTFPEDIYLKAATFVENFTFNRGTYPNTENPNLDGKSVIVFTVVGTATNPTTKYVFCDMEAFKTLCQNTVAVPSGSDTAAAPTWQMTGDTAVYSSSPFVKPLIKIKGLNTLENLAVDGRLVTIHSADLSDGCAFIDGDGYSFFFYDGAVPTVEGEEDTEEEEGEIVPNGDTVNNTLVAISNNTTLLTNSAYTKTLVNKGDCGGLYKDGDGSAVLINSGDFVEILGNSGADTISLSGSCNSCTVYGGAGNDTLTGGTGKNYFYGGDGLNVYVYGGGYDYFADFNETDKIFLHGDTSVENLTVTGGELFATMNVGGAIIPDGIKISNCADRYIAIGDKIYFNELIYNANMTAVTLGSNANATLNSGDYPATVKEIDASARPVAQVSGNSLNNTIYGGSGNDTIYGEGGNDYIDAGAGGANVVFGGEGNDMLIATGGNATFYGGAGNDTFAWNNNYILIRDWETNDFVSLPENAYVKRASLNTSNNIFYATVISATGTQYNNGIQIENAIDKRIHIGDKYYKNNVVFNSNLQEASIAAEHASVVTADELGNAITIDSASKSASIQANAQNNVIKGSTGNDTIYAENGHDTIYANEGHDVIYGGVHNDLIYGEGGNDTIYGESGNDTIYGGKDNDYLDGGADTDIVYGEEGNDTLAGGRSYGWDTLYGGLGVDTFIWSYYNADNQRYEPNNIYIADYEGNENISLPANAYAYNSRLDQNSNILYVGVCANETQRAEYIQVANAKDKFVKVGDWYCYNDLLFNSNKTAVTICGGHSSLLAQGEIPDSVYTIDGSARANIKIYGNANNNSIKAGTGSNTLISGNGSNTLYGGSGNDTFVWCDGYITIQNYADNEIISLPAGAYVSRGLFYTDGDFYATVVSSNGVGYGNAIRVIGGKTNNRWVRIDNTYYYKDIAYNLAKTSATILAEHSATVTADELPSSVVTIDTALRGTITLTGNGQSNYVIGGNGSKYIKGEAGHDTIIGDNWSDTIYGGANEDSIFGADGNDSLFGEDGYDTIYGGAGHDYIDGGAHHDLLFGDAGNDTILGGSYNDTIYGGDGNDSLRGDDNEDLIYGDAGADTILGGAGNDTLYGGADNDRIEMGTGNDAAFGGLGNDTFVWSGGNDTIYDYNEGDVITLSSSAVSSTSYDGVDVIFRLATNNTITVKEGKGKRINVNGTTTLYNG